MMGTDGPGNILHVLVGVGPTNGQYNEHCLPLRRARSVSICSLTKPAVVPPPEIRLYVGDGTARGCMRVVRTALAGDDYDVVHAHAPVSGAMLLVVNLLRGRSMARCAYTMQNSFPNYRLRNRLLLYPLFATFPVVIVCSESARESLPPLLRRLGGRRVSVVPNGVDLDRVDRVLSRSADPDPRRDHAVLASYPHGRGGSGEFRVVSVGRLIEIKNSATLLEAFDEAAVAGSRLTFVGDGPLRPHLTAKAGAMGRTDQVAFTGVVERDDVYHHMARADLYVSTSYGEGMPVAVLEAMASRRPVVLSDIQPHREVAEGADFIPLVPPDDVSGFAAHVSRFATMAKEERDEIGRRCRQLVEDRYSIGAMHRTLSDVYARLSGPAAAARGGA
jgi:glycosyltransferase involved in cell wall biosynthesis